MNYQDFINSLNQETAPNVEKTLLALWYDAKGDWSKAHDIADGGNSKNLERIHAYLHRKEGDSWNANYWYQRSGDKMPQISLEEEWELLAKKFSK